MWSLLVITFLWICIPKCSRPICWNLCFLHGIAFASLSKSWPYLCRFASGQPLFQLIYLPISLPILYYLDYYHFIIIIENQKGKDSCFILFQRCFGYSRTIVSSYMHFRINLSIWSKNTVETSIQALFMNL